MKTSRFHIKFTAQPSRCDNLVGLTALAQLEGVCLEGCNQNFNLIMTVLQPPRHDTLSSVIMTVTQPPWRDNLPEPVKLDNV